MAAELGAPSAQQQQQQLRRTSRHSAPGQSCREWHGLPHVCVLVSMHSPLSTLLLLLLVLLMLLLLLRLLLLLLLSQAAERTHRTSSSACSTGISGALCISSSRRPALQHTARHSMDGMVTACPGFAIAACAVAALSSFSCQGSCYGPYACSCC